MQHSPEREWFPAVLIIAKCIKHTSCGEGVAVCVCVRMSQMDRNGEKERLKKSHPNCHCQCHLCNAIYIIPSNNLDTRNFHQNSLLVLEATKTKRILCGPGGSTPHRGGGHQIGTADDVSEHRASETWPWKTCFWWIFGNFGWWLGCK